MMDPQTQDIVRCDVCDTANPPLHCDFCQTNLCKACVGDHMLDVSKKHQVVPFKDRRSTPKYPNCKKHAPKHCELFCEECDIPICTDCVSSKRHRTHTIADINDIYQKKKEDLKKDLLELEAIAPKYEDIENDIRAQKDALKKNSPKLTSAINQQRENLHQETDIYIDKLKSDHKEKETQHLDVLNKQETEIGHTKNEIKQSIADLQRLQDSNDLSSVFEYNSRMDEFRKLPPKITVSLPKFDPQKINTEQFYREFGSLAKFSITTEERGYTMETSSEAGSSPLRSAPLRSAPLRSAPPRSLLDEPRVISTIQTQYGGFFNELRSVTCKTDEELWTCGDHSNTMRLYNLQGELVNQVQTKSGSAPWDIAVTRSGDLVYTAYLDRTVNIVKNTQIQTVIRLQGWIPRNVCSTSSGDLLVVMDSGYGKQTKVVRYSGSTEKQSIQFNDKGQPLCSSSDTKYISENRNLDICVSDWEARVVVVVNQAGKLRFTYTGPASTTEVPFWPRGITTDSQSRILVADWDNNHIHIVDQDGQFLRYIDNCQLQGPWSLCVDTRDNLFVAENFTGIVKKIQYYK